MAASKTGPDNAEKLELNITAIIENHMEYSAIKEACEIFKKELMNMIDMKEFNYTESFTIKLKTVENGEPAESSAQYTSSMQEKGGNNE